jgi:ABC-type amino acid transport substrate-binding protein
MWKLGVFVIAIVAFSGTAALGCCDKLLAVRRGVRFQHADAAQQANLLIYSAGARSGTALTSTKLQTALKRVVHDMQVVQDSAQLEVALKSGQVNVVLVDAAELTGITRELQSAPSKPVILPIFVKPSKAEFAAAKKEYKFALKAGADDFEYVATIDEAMKLQLKNTAKF